MLVNLQDFVEQADIQDTLYPGKRFVKPCKQIGQYKNHCVVVDWRTPDTLTIHVRPSLSGKVLPPETLKQYPVCFQMPTYVTIKVVNDNADDEDSDKDSSKGGKGSAGGGKKPKQKKTLDEIELIAARFGDSAKGKIPILGEIQDMVVMGVSLAKEAFSSAFTELTQQIKHAKISATEILAKAADMVTRVQPPQFVTPKGDETAQYKYDRDKNANIGFKMHFN